MAYYARSISCSTSLSLPLSLSFNLVPVSPLLKQPFLYIGWKNRRPTTVLSGSLFGEDQAKNRGNAITQPLQIASCPQERSCGRYGFLDSTLVCMFYSYLVYSHVLVNRTEFASPQPAAASLKSIYAPIFRKIDKDNSGSIDSNELYQCISELFPNAQFTVSDVISMMQEADLNDDGVISLDEFSTIMSKAEGANSLWGKTQASLWMTFYRNTTQILAIVDTAATPMREVVRQHSYKRPDGVAIASVGVRLVSCFIGTIAFGFFMYLYYVVMLSSKVIHYGSEYGYNRYSGYNTYAYKDQDRSRYTFMDHFRLASDIDGIHGIIIWNVLCFLIMCVHGCTIEMYIMGLRLANRDTNQHFSIFGLILYLILFNFFRALYFLEGFVLLFTGRTISERILNAVMIVQP